MTLKIQSYEAPRPTVVEKNNATNMITNRISDNPPDYNELGGRKRKAEKNYTSFTKSLYKTPKVLPSYADSLNPKWQYGQYLP